jgi:transcriptional regulator with XRE-family HTH domain
MALVVQLKAARIAAGFSQVELARRIGVSGPNVSQIEAGLYQPSLATAEAWAEACGVKVTLQTAAVAATTEALLKLERPEDRELADQVIRGLPRLTPAVRGMLSVLLAQAEEQERRGVG